MAKRRKKLREVSWTMGSLLAMAAINYAIVHNSFLFVVLAVLLAHELGHYIVARQQGADTRLPLFLPLPFILIGVTKAAHSSRQAQRKIALAGPLAGSVTALIMIAVSWALSMSPTVLMSLCLLLITETVFNFFGADGKRFRAV